MKPKLKRLRFKKEMIRLRRICKKYIDFGINKREAALFNMEMQDDQ